MNDLRDLFFQECDDLVESLTSGLGDLESGAHDAETINAMFRAVHSIKGGAGAFGLDRLIAFAHAFENVLDDIRSDKLQVNETNLPLLFTAGDHLSDLVEAARGECEIENDMGASILSDLKLLSQSVGGGALMDDAPEPEFEPLALDMGFDLPDLGTPQAAASGYAITFAASAELYATGHDPALLFRALGALGEVHASADVDAVPELGDSDWRTPVLRWTLTLTPDDGIDEAALREVFEFVDGLCTLEITAPSAPPDLPDLLPLADPPDTPAPAAADAPVKPSPPPSDPPAAARPSKSDSARTATIRVDLQRVDRLINLVGELVISEAMLRQSMSELPHSASSKTVEEAMGQLKQLSGVIQESVMAIRAQPVRSLFQRMSRTVRETAREAGKQARLVTLGDATEVDKTVTERLVEPLTHMIRNAVDHGLETPEARRAAGKDERGTVTLEAAHRSGRVVITLRDDGAGIDRRKVRQVAEQKGLVRPEDDLTEADIDNLLFRPGFSTASEVSNLSGRGVGMDVVRSEIQALGGRVTLQSMPGQGTQVTISLPLTLAVLEGMVVSVAGESLVVPTLALRETLQPGQARIDAFCDDDRVLTLGHELIPIVDLGLALGYRATPADLDSLSLLLIEGDSGRRTALAVDAIVDQREVVIKGLEQNYRPIPGIAAATILGDGKIALIVDTDQMISRPGDGPSPAALLPDPTRIAHHA
ncbi:MAG: chemotaxis protein CheA [Rhodobacteraceae bacterium]|nr:MAG: chemotaxis protein CheA [Paracoccaceae bacterium]